jgi:hypothetical protein
MALAYKQQIVGLDQMTLDLESLFHQSIENSPEGGLEEMPICSLSGRSSEDIIDTEMPNWPDCDAKLLILSIHESPQSARHRITPDFLAMVLSGIRSEDRDSVMRDLLMLHGLTYSQIYEPLIDSLFWRDVIRLLDNEDETVRNTALQVAENLLISRGWQATYEDVVRMLKVHASNLRFVSIALWNDRVRCIEFYRGIIENHGAEVLSDLLNDKEIQDVIDFAEDTLGFG